MTHRALSPPIPDSYQVDLSLVDLKLPQQALLWAGAYPGSPEPLDARRRMEQFLAVGVSHFINLTEAGERSDHYESLVAEAAEKRNTAVIHQRIPIADYSVPTPETLNLILDTIDDSLAQGNMVYVHCWGGIGRTGTVIGCWLVRHGISGTQALAQIAHWRSDLPSGNIESPETDEQREMVLTWGH